MKTRWYSRNCYVKRIPNEYNDDLNEWETSLYSLNPISAGELVASFENENEIDESKHFIRNSASPNCQIIGKNVYANEDIPAETELSLNYHGILL